MSLYGTGSGPKVELQINNTWTDVTPRARAAQKVTITRGRVDEQTRTTAQTAQMTLENTDGVLSNRNPNSPYFGLLPRNTRVRVTAGAGDNYAKVVYSDQASLASDIRTADKASLDITGDIDIRCDIQPYSWHTGFSQFSGVQGMTIASKGASSGNLSWVFYMLGDGTLRFRWYPAGTTSGQLTAASSIPIPPTSGRLTVRVTLKANNGASGNTVTFYTGSSVTGTFTQLGSAVTQSGTTSIFASSADLILAGGGDGHVVFFSDIPAYGGRFFRFQMYNGIAGTLVADMDATSRTPGDIFWSDGLTSPNTWVVEGTARITTDRIRFTGELSSLPQTWDPTGNNVTVPVTASGIMRRLTQGPSPLQSPMVRNFNQYNPNGYWSLEDGPDATSLSSLVPGGRAGTFTAVSTNALATGLPGAAACVQFSDATSVMRFTAAKATSTGTASFVFYVNLSALPTTQKIMARLYTSGTFKTINVSLNATQWVFDFLAGDGTNLGGANVSVTGINPASGWVGVNLLLQQSGGNVNYSVRWDALGASTGVGIGPIAITSATTGVPTGAFFTATDTVFTTAKYAHLFMSTGNFDLTNGAFRNASNAWLGETAAARLTRLSLEENEPIEIWGIQNDSELMGYQLIDTFMANVYDCTDTDGGMLGECRDSLSLLYRTRGSLYSRNDVTLSYAQSHLAQVPQPTEDDQAFTNDVTVSRPSGGSARSSNTDGSTSVSDPPAGVGHYITAVSRNVANESQLPNVAGWLMLTGSWDEARYPNLVVGLHRAEILSSNALTLAMIALEIGDTIDLTGLPSWMPPDDVYELLQGYTETLDKFTWTWTANCTPAAPYANVAVAGSTYLPVRADGTTHSLGGSLTTTATSLSLVTPAGSVRWVDSATYPAEFPFNIKITGEVMTVTAITGTSSPQTATVTRSVNGIVKTHSSGELVRLAVPFYIGR